MVFVIYVSMQEMFDRSVLSFLLMLMVEESCQAMLTAR
jgi:hypothetical protein